jgi:hypothetical protein
MSKRKVLAGLGLMVALGACGSRSPDVAYTAPGWYLEKPHLILATGPEIFAGPMSYDDCEAKRTSFPPPTSSNLLCIMEKTKPGRFGPYSSSPPAAASPSQSS